MASMKIIGLCILAAVAYGILHDQVTARICVEYFTIGHPPIFNTDSPTLLAIGWGIIATWWVGVLLGIPAAFVSRFGSLPKIEAIQLVRPILVLLLIVGFGSLLAGLAGYIEGLIGGARLTQPLASRMPNVRHPLYIADLWAHLAAYRVGLLGGIILCVRIYLQRKRKMGIS